MKKTGKALPQESELYELRARVVELDAEDDVLLEQVERAAIDAIRP